MGDDRVYMYASMVIIVLALVPFYYSFEKGKPHARKVVLIAVLTALAVASRAAFFMTPGFKPVLAFVIIGGVSLDANSGFIIGSMSAFVSNFLFGQGPWTPFQMVAWGLIGFFAGLFQKQLTRGESLIPLSIYAVITSYVLHGAITDLWTIMAMTDHPNLHSVVAVYSAGIVFDTVLAAATVIFLFIFAKPLIRKIDRVKIKYGI